MKGLFQKKILLAFAVVALFVLYLFDNVYTNQAKKHKSVNVYSYNVDGLGVFYELANKVDSNKIQISQEAFLNPIEVDKFSTLVILSPKIAVSKREAQIIKRYVEEGGFLILSAANPSELELLAPLLNALSLPTKIYSDDSAKNQVVKRIVGGSGSSLFDEKEMYTIYSGWTFNKQSSVYATAEDYLVSKDIAKGRVELMIGLPVFSNALIQFDHNRDLAFRILSGSRMILVDEYRHMFTKKALSDLLLKTSFYLPLLGMSILALLYLLFSEGDDLGSQPKDSNTDDVSYHSLNASILHGLWKSKDLLTNAVQDRGLELSRKFPEKGLEIKNLINQLNSTQKGSVQSLGVFQKIVSLHKELLAERGIRNKL